MGRRRSVAEAKALLPLLRSISAEIHERQAELHELEARREAWLRAARASGKGEGFTQALQTLDADIAGHSRRVESALAELYALGIRVPTLDPLVIHIPGRTAEGEVLFFFGGEGASSGGDRSGPERAEPQASADA